MSMSRTVPGRADVADATRRYLMYGVMPFWFAPGIADYLLHRRTRIQDTSGTRESVIHAAMMTEVGIPVLMGLFFEINPLVLAVMAGAALVHEGTAIWDVQTAVDGGREVRPAEQHVHSFLESLPFGAVAAIGCLHWPQVRRLAAGADRRAAWSLRAKRPALSRRYRAGVLGAVAGLIALPYAEELLRCARAEARRGPTTTG
jgi:hypothetical protein